MIQGTIITIGRQYGSGGRNIGIRLAKELGVPFYDQNILKQAAEESGLCEKILQNYDEKPRSFLYSIAMDPFGYALGVVGDVEAHFTGGDGRICRIGGKQEGSACAKHEQGKAQG